MQVKSFLKLTMVLLSALLLIFTAFAHEYILLASKFNVAKGDMLELHLFVADGMNIEMERTFQRNITKKFELITQNGRADLAADAQEGPVPVLNREVDFDGLGLIHMERDYTDITFDNKKFLAYLEEDHLENIRAKIDYRKSQQKERYTRYIKCLVQSKKLTGDTLYKANMAHPFEIILLANPYTLKKGNTLKAQVLFMGKPLAGKVITARNRTGSEPATRQLSRTNAQGICSFVINRKGDWLLHATHMIASQNPQDADWDSFWASYCFGME